MALFAQYAMVAAEEAVVDAKLESKAPGQRERVV